MLTAATMRIDMLPDLNYWLKKDPINNQELTSPRYIRNNIHQMISGMYI